MKTYLLRKGEILLGIVRFRKREHKKSGGQIIAAAIRPKEESLAGSIESLQ